MRPRSGSSAKALLLTALGEFVLPHRGSVWTSTVIRSLGALGVEERNARQALARLADQDVVRSHREGRRASWHLTDAGRALLTSGTERIYQFGGGDDAWDGRWLVVLCSVPEEQRAKRHQLRSQLGFAGFGFLAPGVALSPHLDREALANQVLEDLELVPGAVVFRAETGDLASTEVLLERAWDLDALASRYEDFLRAFGRRSPHGEEARFVALTELVHEWRHFPFIDPEIPHPLLPDGWPGRRAKALFDDRHAAWASGANRWYEALDGAGTDDLPQGRAIYDNFLT
jgi:phenylacetic acid degradation operon negative regulatory protein